MSVHGGSLDRPLSRITVLVGSAAAAVSLLAGCASVTPGPAVVVQPVGAQAVPTPAASDFLTGLQQAVASELNAINSTQSDNEPPAVLIQLNALISESALLQAENFGSLITTGANQIAKRERLVNALLADVKSSSYLDGVAVKGVSLSQSLLSLLGRVDGQLQSLASSISSATLTDVLRADILSIAGTRVLGLVQPQIHLAIAGGEELNGVGILQAKYETLLTKVNHNHHDLNYAAEVARLQNLGDNIATVRATATADVLAVLSLSPSGWPGNKATILRVRAELAQLRSPLGPLNTAVGDVNEISSLLSLRVS